MIVQQKMREAATAAGFDVATIARFEGEIDAYAERLGRSYRRGEVPPEVPAAYQAALERGWVDGILLIQRIGANARYFTDSAGKVAIDVSMGDAAVGMAIDFYARYQAQVAGGPLGEERMVYVTPVGGTSVSCDPIGLLRGAPHREVALRFIEYVLGEDGQRLWTYLPGTPGGPERYALRRLPVRRDFYPSPVPAIEAAYERHRRYAADDLGDPSIDPYQVAQHFTYYPRWTARHFGVQREIIRAMALDSGEDLRAAWQTLRQTGRSSAGAMLMRELPTVTLTNRRTGKIEAVPLTLAHRAGFLRELRPARVPARVDRRLPSPLPRGGAAHAGTPARDGVGSPGLAAGCPRRRADASLHRVARQRLRPRRARRGLRLAAGLGHPRRLPRRRPLHPALPGRRLPQPDLRRGAGREPPDRGGDDGARPARSRCPSPGWPTATSSTARPCSRRCSWCR